MNLDIWIYATEAAMTTIIWGLAGVLGRWLYERKGSR